MQAFIWFIVVITPIVFFHELGHFLFARLFGVKVSVFSIGFGKPLLKWKDSKDTTWQIALIPLGGYIKMYGDEGVASTPDVNKLQDLSETEKGTSFYYKKLWQKALIVFGGPFANYILAILIFTCIALYSGVIEFKTEVTGIKEGSPAQKAGMQVGDTIVEMNGKKVTSVYDLKSTLALNVDDKITIGYIRDNVYFSTNIIPELEVSVVAGEQIKQPVIGAMFGKYTYNALNPLQATIHAVRQAFDLSSAMLQAVWQMLTGKRNTDDLGGPIKIAKYSEKIAEQGLSAFLYLIAIISLNLGLVNLLPIPMLDGGHLFYYAIEAIIRKPISYKAQNIGFRIGFAIIIGLMIIAFWNDLKSIEFIASLKNNINK